MKKLSLFALPLISALFLCFLICFASIDLQPQGGVSLQTITEQNTPLAVHREITSQGKININTASQRTLMLLPGIGQVLAERIVSYREEYGLFAQITDLLNVKGIGDVKLGNIASYISLE